MNAVMATANAPSASAASSEPLSSARMPRAARRIQKIMHVTNTTATIESVPPKISRDSKLWRTSADVYVSSAPNAALSTTAVATPTATGAIRSRRPVLTR